MSWKLADYRKFTLSLLPMVKVVALSILIYVNLSKCSVDLGHIHSNLTLIMNILVNIDNILFDILDISLFFDVLFYRCSHKVLLVFIMFICIFLNIIGRMSMNHGINLEVFNFRSLEDIPLFLSEQLLLAYQRVQHTQ